MCVLYLIRVLSVDPSLGKVDRHSLPQQALMELFIEGIANKDVIYGDPENREHIAEWGSPEPRLIFDDAHNLTDVLWMFLSLVGTISWKWLPTTVEIILLYSNNLSGSIDLEDLPESLREMDNSANAFTGTICLLNLPHKLAVLELLGNKLSGSLNLEKLPESLKLLNLEENFFEGTVSLISLPPKLESLYISKNRLLGTIDVTKLPHGIKRIFLSQNGFEGETDFLCLPRSLQEFDISNNDLSGDIYIGSDKKGGFFAAFTQVNIHVSDPQ